jgi:hypothetical protein
VIFGLHRIRLAILPSFSCFHSPIGCILGNDFLFTGGAKDEILSSIQAAPGCVKNWHTASGNIFSEHYDWRLDLDMRNGLAAR